MRGNDPKPPIDYIETLVGIFTGENVLEGFRANAEKLCSKRDNTDDFCETFYKMCIEDNSIIFDFTTSQNIKIPKMTMEDLNTILFKKLKLNKAADIFQVTVEHLRNAGPDALQHILTFENRIIEDINNITCPEIKTSIGTVIHKGKGKPANHHKSYRQVRVSPYLGRILDEFMRPKTAAISRPLQDPNQYGFTEDMTYSSKA